MAGKQAKILSADHIDDLLFFVAQSRHPLRNRLIVLFSVRAGLRAAEIAQLTWQMVLNASGDVGPALELEDKIAKKRSGRRVPLHAELRQALIEARELCDGTGPIIRSARGGPMTPLSIVVWFNRVYRIASSGLLAVRLTPVAEPLSPVARGSFMKRVARSATCSSSQVIDQFKPRSGMLMATAMPRESWCRCYDGHAAPLPYPPLQVG
ncbi:tyrosine-type recombinase/integrase [Bradyrhizobium sp. 26S5]|uniref:tyrosine-type recombinase/integrase n=1 Tax=Bradyrhizobium sp. 26S5 TaxID=3139729 RepID=UPI0030CF46C5